jgi:hypothetical protein
VCVLQSEVRNNTREGVTILNLKIASILSVLPASNLFVSEGNM